MDWQLPTRDRDFHVALHAAVFVHECEMIEGQLLWKRNDEGGLAFLERATERAPFGYGGWRV
jgi:hypothetical protein